MRTLVRALIRWFWILVLCIIVGYFAGKGLAVLLPPNYQATALVLLNAQTHTSTIIQPVAAYSSLVTSDEVLGAALQKYPGLDRTSVMTKDLLVTPNNSSGTITIQVTLSQAKEAAGLANDLARLLVSQQNAYIQQQYTKELQILNGRIASDKQTIDQLNQKILSTPATNTTAIQQLQSQVSQYQNLENQDINLQQTLQTEQALYSQPLSAIQTATPPTKPSSIIGQIPVTPVVILILVLVGLLIISLLERRANRVYDIDRLQQRKLTPILGALRWNRSAPPEIPLVEICTSKTHYAEECRVMMADILYHAESAKAQILAITSLRSRAGNSSIAAQLAALLAQSKRRVLLIDANLSAPSLHQRLQVPNKAGLAKMLEEAPKLKVPLTPVGTHIKSKTINNFPEDNYVLSTPIPNLYLLPAGGSTLNPSSLLSMPEMEEFLKRSTEHADYIVIDCPALSHAEAHVLGSLSDQTYLVVDATKDRVSQVEQVKKELADSSVKLSGYLVNKLGRWV